MSNSIIYSWLCEPSNTNGKDEYDPIKLSYNSVRVSILRYFSMGFHSECDYNEVFRGAGLSATEKELVKKQF